jgi:twitching motility protein PilT
MELVKDRKKLGQVFIEHKLVDVEQVNIALRQQRQKGGKIGSILLELGYLRSEELLTFLSKHFGVPSADLYKLIITPEVLSILPYEKIKEYEVIPVAVGAKNVFLVMANPDNDKILKDIGFLLGKTVQPIVVAASQMEEALRYLAARHGDLKQPLVGSDLVNFRASSSVLAAADLNLRDLIEQLQREAGSDLLLSAGVPPSIKKNNEIVRLNLPCLTPEQVRSFAFEVMTAEQKEEFASNSDIDFGFTCPEVGRFRINIFKQRSSMSIAIRTILEEIPTLASLGLPSWISQFALRTQGLILVTGPTGHGKSTTLAAMVDIINSHRRCNIITIEDPIEYLHKHKLSNVNQREVGRDTSSFNQGLRRIFRQAPDVIVIGEMRDAESFAIAIQAAETGHLVLSTLHSNYTTSAIERIIDVFPPEQQQQIRVQLAENILLVFNQRLVPRRDGKGRMLVYEKLQNSPRVRNLIREGKTHQIRTLFQQSIEEYESMDYSLARQVREGRIMLDEALKYSENPTMMRDLATRKSA